MKAYLRCENVSIRFMLQHERSTTLKERVISMLRPGREQEEFWAVRGASFSMEQGESIGIIGANGSGKSTLLKAIAGIYHPDEGKIQTEGRISALLELGAGFHPDLTGRQNLYIFGAIQGFSRAEMKERIPRIINFAELQRFIDIPVKNYSSGMYTRLGFSAAIGVQPDLLLVDEILAVGDVSFQAKCFQRIEEMQQRGTSLVMVSHDLNSVERYCQKALVVHQGKQVFFGPVQEAIDRYLEIHSPAVETTEGLPPLEEGPSVHPRAAHSGTGGVEILQAQARQSFVQTPGGEKPGVELRFSFRSMGNVFDPDFAVDFRRASGESLFKFSSRQMGYEIGRLPRRGWVILSLVNCVLQEETTYLTVECLQSVQKQLQCRYEMWYRMEAEPGLAEQASAGEAIKPMFRLSLDPFWRCEPCQMHYAQAGLQEDWARQEAGWHCVEYMDTGFRWSKGEAVFAIHNPNAAKQLVLRAGAGYLLDKDWQVSGQVYQDGAALGRLVLPTYELTELYFDLKKPDKEFSMIRIALDKYLGTEERMDSVDPRELGVTLVDVRLLD